MTTEVRVVQPYDSDRIYFYVLDRDPMGRASLLGSDGVFREVPEGEAYPSPTLTLDEGAARSLTENLVRFFNGTEDTRSLRRDYDAERGRVDRLIDSISRIAERP